MSEFGKKRSGGRSASFGQARPQTNAVPRTGASPRQLSTEAEAFLSGLPGNEPQRGAYPSSNSPSGGPVIAGKPVGFIRLIASIVDSTLILLPYWIIFGADISAGFVAAMDQIQTLGTDPNVALFVNLFDHMLILAVITTGYFVAMEGSSWQATLGKRMVGVVVTDKDGAKLGFGRVFLRNTVGRFVTNLVPFSIGYIMCLFGKNHQCLHDMIAGTTVRVKGPSQETYSDVFA